MRVAYVCADPDVPAFARRAQSLPVREMCAAMLEAGFEVSLFVSARGGETPARLAGVPVTDLRAPTAVDPDAQTREAVTLNGEIASALARSAPFDVIYERASRWSVAPMHYAAKASAIGILELHAPVVHRLSEDTTSLPARAARALLGHALGSARLVVTASAEVAARAQAVARGHANIHVVPAGCDPRCLAQLSGQRSRGHFVVGYVGALGPGHGLETLIDAFATLVATNVPHAQLLIVGDGPQRHELVKRAARLGLANSVTFTSGAVDGLSALLAKMNVAVAPHTEQVASLSPTISECMAAGLPVVASANAIVSAIVDHDSNGMLFQPGDAAGLASALGQLHADPLRLRRLGHKARSYAADHFTWGTSLERILALAGAAPHPKARLAPERTTRDIA
jgi:glycosyltransferase involved in cell wall biosynthesis